MSVQVSYNKQFLIMMMFLIIILSLLETSARIYDFFNPECNFMVNEVSKNLDYGLKVEICRFWLYHLWITDPITGISTSEPNQHSATLNINSYGFRGPEFQKEKPENTYRIFMVGGSTTFSPRAISDNHTIPGYLQENFNQSHQFENIEVINAGNPGITSIDELQTIKTKIQHIDPDLILIYDGWNDANAPYGHSKDPNRKVVSGLDYLYKKYFSFYETPRILDRMIKGEGPNHGPTEKRVFDDSNAHEKASLWKNNLATICEIGKQKNFETVIFLQPFLGTGNKTLTEHEKKIHEILDLSKVTQLYHLFSNELEDLKNDCTLTVDLRNIFDDEQESVYFDEAHIGSEYNRLIADRIFEELTSAYFPKNNFKP